MPGLLQIEWFVYILSHVPHLAIPWTGPPLSGIFQARMLEWVASSYSRRSVQWREVTHVSCIGRWILRTLRHLGTPSMVWILEISCQNSRILVHRNLNV